MQASGGTPGHRRQAPAPQRSTVPARGAGARTPDASTTCRPLTQTVASSSRPSRFSVGGHCPRSGTGVLTDRLTKRFPSRVLHLDQHDRLASVDADGMVPGSLRTIGAIQDGVRYTIAISGLGLPDEWIRSWTEPRYGRVFIRQHSPGSQPVLARSYRTGRRGLCDALLPIDTVHRPRRAGPGARVISYGW